MIGLIYESVIFGLTQLGAVRVYLSVENLCSNPIVLDAAVEVLSGVLVKGIYGKLSEN